MLEKFEGMGIGWDFSNPTDNNCIMLLNAGRGAAEIARAIYTKDEEGTHIVKGYAVVEIAKVRELERKKNEVEQELYVLKDEIAVLEKALKLCVKEYLYWFYENDTTIFDTEELVAKYKDEEYLRFISQAEKELEGKNNDKRYSRNANQTNSSSGIHCHTGTYKSKHYSDKRGIRKS